MKNDFGSPIRYETLPFEVARVVLDEGAELLAKERQVEIFTRSDGALLALFSTAWRLQALQRQHPSLQVFDMAEQTSDPRAR
jgi:peptide chain release factor 3